MPTNERQWDIRREGRRWSAEEAEHRSCHVIPDRPEIHHGKLYFTDEERMAVAACLLENLGIDKVVQSLGSLSLWQAAVAALNVQVPTRAPATLPELADQAAAAFGTLDRELDEYFAALQQLDPELSERAVARAGGRELATLLLLCPSAELGGKSALQLLAAGKRQEVEMLFNGE